MSTSNYIRPMNFVEIIKSLIGIYKESFVPLSVITLINSVVSYLLLEVALGTNSIVLGFFVLLLLPVFYTGPILVAMSNTVLGKPVNVLESYRKGLSLGLLFQTFLAALPAILIALVVAFGNYTENTDTNTPIIVFYVVFFALMSGWIFFSISLFLEKKGFFQSIARSFSLFLRNIGRSILVTLVCAIFAIPLVLIGMFLENLFGLSLIRLVFPIPFVSMLAISLYVMSYYEIRARRENYTENILSQELGFAPLDEMMSL